METYFFQFDAGEYHLCHDVHLGDRFLPRAYDDISDYFLFLCFYDGERSAFSNRSFPGCCDPRDAQMNICAGRVSYRALPAPYYGGSMDEQVWYLYILRCGDGTFYTGITTDIERRLKMHQTGKGAKYTRGRGPLTLMYTEKCTSHSQALSREAEIKAMRRKEKEGLFEAGVLDCRK